MNSKEMDWRNFWTEYGKKIKTAAIRISLGFPLAVVLGIQFSLLVSCAIEDQKRCIWIWSLFGEFPLKVYLLVLFGIFVLCCQVVFYFWQQYRKKRAG